MSNILRITLLLFLLTLFGCSDDANHSDLTVEHAARGAFAAAISHDGQYSLISSVEHGVSLWDNNTHGLKYQWYQSQTQDNLVHSLAIAYDNSFAVTAESNTFAIWDIQTGKNRGFFQIKQGTIRDIAISNQGRYVLYGRSDNVVVHWIQPLI